MTVPVGIHSRKLAAVRALRTPAGRRAAGCFIIEGTTMVAEALRGGVTPETIFATEQGYQALAEQGLAAAMPVHVVAERALGKLSALESPPGVVAVVRSRTADLDELLAAGEPVALLAGIADPGNAGTLMRTAEIFGIERLIFGTGSVEPHNPKVVRGSMGAIFRIAIAEAGGPQIRAAAQRHGYRLIAAAPGGTPLPSFRFVRRSIVAIGHERRGVAATLESWDDTLTIPQLGSGDSLNAAVAGGIIFHAFSQQVKPHTSIGPKPEKP